MDRKAVIWEEVSMGRGVDRVVVYFIALVAKHVCQGPAIWV